MDAALGTVSLLAGVMGLRLSGVARWRDLRWVPYVAFAAALLSFAHLLGTHAATAAWTTAAFRLEILGACLVLVAYAEHVGGTTGIPPSRAERAGAVALLALGAVAQVPGTAFRIDTALSAPGPLELRPTLLTVGIGAVFLAVCGGLALRVARAVAAGRAVGVQLLSLVAMAGGAAYDLVRFATGTADGFVVHAAFAVPVLAETWAFVGRVREEAGRLEVVHGRLVEQAERRTTELDEARDDLARAERLSALGRITAHIAHEINNPATVVRGNLGYVLDRLGEGERLLPEDGQAALRDAATAIERVSDVVQQLQVAGNVAASPLAGAGPVSLEEAVTAALRRFPSLPAPSTSLEVDVDPSLTVAAHRSGLESVVVNLLQNAVRAIQDRGGTGGAVRISGRPDASGARALIEVVDDGVGMSDAVREQMFEPFFTTRPFGHGAGLGLSVTLGLVRSMGGELTVESSPGEGTLVTVALPRARAATGDDPDGDDAPVSGMRTRQTPADVRPHVLLVEDDALVLRAIERRLRREYAPEAVGGVREAIERLARDPEPDLVLCDVMMGDGGGQAVYRATLRARPALARRFVFVTGGATDQEAQRFLAGQPQPVLEKPLDLDELRSTVDALLEAERAPEGHAASPGPPSR